MDIREGGGLGKKLEPSILTLVTLPIRCDWRNIISVVGVTGEK